MDSTTAARRIGTLALALAVLALSTTMAWATARDYDARGSVPGGVSVDDTDLSGMSESRARDTIRTALSAPLLRPVTVTVDERSYAFDPRSAVALDVDAMIDEAYAPRRGAAYLSRLYAEVTSGEPETQVTPRYAVDEAVLADWVARLARRVDERAIDASLTVIDSRVRITPSKAGRRLDRAAATAALKKAFAADEALQAGERTIRLDSAPIRPRVTEKSFGQTIVVDVSERRIRLFNGDKIEKTYPCAVGTPGYPTPKGVFEIVLKRYMPTWVNPAPNGWGADMPASIPPGPSNPLGTRALNLSAPGIRFHGTTKTGSIGSAASHGCMRMLRADIEDFYERVKVGTKVHIVD